MTVDEQVRTALESAASEVPSAYPGDLDVIRRRGRRRITSRRIGWGLVSVAGVAAVLVFTIPYDPNPLDPAETHQVETVEIADLAVPVANAEPVLNDPDVWLGLPGPAPRFDTTELGPDLSFTPGEPAPGDLGEDRMRNDGWPEAVQAVYLGDLDGEPFYLYSAPAPSIWDRISEVIHGNFSGDILGTTLNCCSGGDMDRIEGLAGFGHSSSTDQKGVTTEVIMAEWLGLSPEVSVIAYRFDGEFFGWQTPVSGVASLQLETLPEEVEFIAFDATGREVDRFGPIVLDSGSGITESIKPGTVPEGVEVITDWAPMTTEGSEIGPEEISSERLLETIDPRPGDRLFLVPVESGEIIVRVRGDLAHAYAEECSALNEVDLPPGWGGTCLG